MMESTMIDFKRNLKRIWQTFDDDEVPNLKKPKDVKRNGSRSRGRSLVPDLHKLITSSEEEEAHPIILGTSNSHVLGYLDGEHFFKRYHLRHVLGSGGFATTYLCIEKETGLKLACKVIDKETLISEEDRTDVRLEIKMLMHLPLHKNVVQFFGAYEDEQKVYLLMELCEGGELLDRMINVRVYNESDAAAILKDTIQAVKVCHEHGILHRDLKPENLLYTTKEKAAPLKVIDFGLSTFFTPGQRFHEVVGTCSYIAPEVLMKDYGPEVDIWSAGVILYCLLSGQTPFSGTDEEIEVATINGETDFEGGHWPEISAEARDLVMGMLNCDPSKRLTIQQILEHRWLVKMEAHKVEQVKKAKSRGRKNARSRRNLIQSHIQKG